MKLSIICAGLSHLYDDSIEGKGTGFYRTPRISMARNCQQFLPDYALLMLVDEIVMGRRTYEGLVRGLIDSVPAVPLAVKLLHDEGFIRLEDFDGAIGEQQAMLEQQVTENMGRPDAWVPALWKSVASWRWYFEGLQLTLRPRMEQVRAAVAAGKPVTPNFARAASVFIHHMGGRYQMVKYYAEEILSAMKGAPDAESLKEFNDFLREQLIYVESGLMLCRKYSAGLHDWCDFDPHYDEAIAHAVARPANTEAGLHTRALFQASVPELILWHPDNILRALRDKRVAEVRDRVRDCVAGEGALDRAAVDQLLDAVGSIENGVGRVRLVTAFNTDTPGLMPGVKPVAGEAAPTLLRLSSQSIDATAAERIRLEAKEITD